MINQKEFIPAALDACVLARCHAIRYRNLATGVASENNAGVGQFQHQLRDSVQEMQSGLFRRRQRGHRRHRQLFAAPPDYFANLDVVTFAFDGKGRNPSGRMLKHGGQQFNGGPGGDDLHRFGKSGHARSQIDGIAKDIIVFFDHRPGMEAHANRTLYIGYRRQRRNFELHIRRGEAATVSVRQYAHHLVADGFDHPTPVLPDNAAHQDNALIHHFFGLGVAQGVIQLGTPRNIGK